MQIRDFINQSLGLEKRIKDSMTAENILAGYKRIGLEARRPWRVETLLAGRAAEAPGSSSPRPWAAVPGTRPQAAAPGRGPGP